MNGPDTAHERGDTQLLGTVVESLNTALEVAIRYPQPQVTTPAVAERQRPSDLDLGKECHQLATRSD